MFENKTWLVFVVLGPVLAIGVVLGYFFYFGNSGLHAIEVKGETLYVTIADTEAARVQGLSGRERLGENEGMLFVYQTDGTYRFWMKDMRFAIDILWIDANGKIIYIQKSLVPATFPETFGPSEKHALARYVLEVPAGYSNEHNIKIGDMVSI